jgi:hypothetical protein
MPLSPASHLPTASILQRMSSPTLEKLPLFASRTGLLRKALLLLLNLRRRITDRWSAYMSSVFIIRKRQGTLESLQKGSGSEHKRGRKQTAANSLLVYTILKQLAARGFVARTYSTTMPRIRILFSITNTKTRGQDGQMHLQLPHLIVGSLAIRTTLPSLRGAACLR